MRRLATALLAALALTVAPAHADVYDDNPAAASRGSGDMVVLARGADGAIYERHLEGSRWTAWTSIGGSTSSGPAAAAYGDTIHAFVLGSDFALYENVLRAGQWSGWTSLGGKGTSAPSASARRGEDALDVVMRGTDNQMHLRVFRPGAGWYGWQPLGGNLTSAPALVSQVASHLNIWARGTDGQLYQKGWTPAGWVDWFSLGGGLIGAPSVVARMDGHLDVYVRGHQDALYQRTWTAAGAWTPWAYVDARRLDSTPAAVSDTPDHVVLAARAGGTVLIKEWRESSGYSDWVDFGPVAPPPPPAPPPQDGLADLQTGVRCTPPGGRLKVRLRIRKRRGAAKPQVRRVVFFVRQGPRKTDRNAPYVAHLRLNRPAGSTGRVYARAVYTRKGSRKLRRRTVSRRFVMCG